MTTSYSNRVYCGDCLFGMEKTQIPYLWASIFFNFLKFIFYYLFSIILFFIYFIFYLFYFLFNNILKV